MREILDHALFMAANQCGLVIGYREVTKIDRDLGIDLHSEIARWVERAAATVAMDPGADIEAEVPADWGPARKNLAAWARLYAGLSVVAIASVNRES